jgi:hypothetical protein
MRANMGIDAITKPTQKPNIPLLLDCEEGEKKSRAIKKAGRPVRKVKRDPTAPPIQSPAANNHQTVFFRRAAQ